MFFVGFVFLLIFNFYNVAGVIIGKGGKNVAELREQTNCKAGVSKVVAGVHERVLTITGTVQGVAKVSTYLFILTLLFLNIHLGLFNSFTNYIR